MIKIQFHDKSEEYKEGVSLLEIAKDKSKDAIAARLNDKLVDLSTKVMEDSTVKFITFDDKEGMEIFMHSASHLMTQAVLRIYKNQDVGLGVGVAVDMGFYQDYDIEPLKPKDLKRIEEEMRRIVKEELEITQKDVPKKEVLKFYEKDPYKIELANAIPGDMVSMYTQGEFDNLCKGPHVPNISYIKAFKLMKIAGAYWRGDSKNKMLQRIYGTAFPSKEQLKDYLSRLEEAKKRDHRVIGKKLDLFSFHEEAPGMPFFHDKGSFIFDKLVKFMIKKMRALNYEINKTPIILNKSLWLQSGHWDHYKENMYYTKIDKNDYAVKPMNCPGNLLIYKTGVHSYRELPIKAGEFGLVHRHELSGVLSGLFRVRSFTQDDAHVFCTEEQLEEQLIELIELCDSVYKTFGFEYNVELSTRPAKAMGSQEVWDKAEGALKNALKKKKMDYKINPGDGAFYGPKIDYHLKDAIGRTWQCGTIQVDFSMPEKFDLTYEGQDGKKHRPVMIHRAIYGSLERFLGILVEHFAGKFPLWINPVQVSVITVADRFNDYADKIFEELKSNGLRVIKDYRTESVGKKVRDAQVKKIPIVVNIGEKEVDKNTVAVRTLDGKLKFGIKLSELIESIKKNIDNKEIAFNLE